MENPDHASGAEESGHVGPLGDRSARAGLVIGPYRILSLLGSGGMGEVYKALDTRLEREVAIKFLPHAAEDDPEQLSRFRREAQLLASLNHPNIASIYGLEESEGIVGLVLEFVPGETLAQRLRGGRLEMNEALRIAGQIALGLDSAHEKGIIHRDLKPANVKVTPEGKVKVLDFGLAKAFKAGSRRQDLTESFLTTVTETLRGTILGTPAYMSPEQARGKPLDVRTDIWSFGCVLYEMLAGRSAFGAGTLPDTIAAVVGRDPDWNLLTAEVPDAIRSLLRRCLQKDLDRRMRHIGDVRLEIEEAVNRQPAEQEEAPIRKTALRWLPWTVAVLALSIAGLALIFNAARDGGVPADVQFTRLTWDSGLSIEPALSPDGTMVAYASDRHGEKNLDLWLQRIGGGEPIRLTDDPADDRDPSFSPDGAAIVFHSGRRGGGIYIVPALGGDARLLVQGGRGPRFSPDGRQLAFWTGLQLGTNAPPGSKIFTVAPGGGERTQIAADFAAAAAPVWSPDGRSLLFLGRRQAGEPFDWWFVNLKKQHQVASGAYHSLDSAGLLTGDETSGESGQPTPDLWTTRGVLFTVPGQRARSANLWLLPVSMDTGKVEGVPARVTSGAGEDAYPSSDSRGRIAFSVLHHRENVFALPLEPVSGRVLGEVVRLTLDAGLPARRGSVSRDGRWLADPRHRSGVSELWIKDLVSGREQHLVTTPPSQLNPIASSRGRYVAYTVRDASQPNGHVVTVATGLAEKVCNDCILADWTSDERTVLASSGSPRSIVAIDIASRAATVVLQAATTGGGTGLGRLALSPDDRWIAFRSSRSMWIAPFRPGKPAPETEWKLVRKLDPGNTDRETGWSPDGRLLYVLLDLDGFRCLYAQSFDPVNGVTEGEPFPVHHFHDPRSQWGSTPFGSAIAGRMFIYNHRESTGGIWLMEPVSR